MHTIDKRSHGSYRKWGYTSAETTGQIRHDTLVHVFRVRHHPTSRAVSGDRWRYLVASGRTVDVVCPGGMMMKLYSAPTPRRGSRYQQLGNNSINPTKLIWWWSTWSACWYKLPGTIHPTREKTGLCDQARPPSWEIRMIRLKLGPKTLNRVCSWRQTSQWEEQ